MEDTSDGVPYDNSRLGADLAMDIAVENGVLPGDDCYDLPTGPGKRVIGLRVRSGIPVVGEMLPYRPVDRAERIRDDSGDVWFVESSTVHPLPLTWT